MKQQLNTLLFFFLVQIFINSTYLNSFDIDVTELEDLNFNLWSEQCKKQIISEKTFMQIIENFNVTCFEDYSKLQLWTVKAQPEQSMNYVCSLLSTEFETTYIIGDLHGNFDDFCKILNHIIKYEQGLSENLKLNNANFIFLGDYTDRGKMGLETLSTIMLLKIINPERVVTIRGNHEDLDLNFAYGFLKELETKLKKYNHSFVKVLNTTYNLMPAAAYLTFDKKIFIHCSHAGFEFRYNPKKFLDNLNDYKLQFDSINLLNKDYYSNILNKNLDIFFSQFNFSQNNPLINFTWADILLKNNIDPIVQTNIKRGPEIIQYNEKFLNKILKEYVLKDTFTKFIRGHQHFLPKKTLQPEETLIPELTSGATNLNKKIITLISATIQYENSAAKYYPIFLKLQPTQSGQFNIEAINIT